MIYLVVVGIRKGCVAGGGGRRRNNFASFFAGEHIGGAVAVEVAEMDPGGVHRR